MDFARTRRWYGAGTRGGAGWSVRRSRMQGTLALACGASALRLAFELITQNVDGLHARAGSAPIELHGNLMRTVCLARCGFVEDDPQLLASG